MAREFSKEVEKIVYCTKHRVEAIKCDVCGRTIIPGVGYRTAGNRYFEVTIGHRDWGNDSHESIKHLDVCPECISDYVSSYTRNCKGTEYLGLQTAYITKHDYEEKYSDEDE